MSNLAAAKKLEKRIGQAKTNIRLMKRAGYENLAKDAEAYISHYLEKREIHFPPIFKELGLDDDVPYSVKKQRLGLPPNVDSKLETVQEFQKFFEDNATAARLQMWRWRIAEHTRYMAEKGWYGFFVTLTVDPGKCADSYTMWKEHKEFPRYIKRLARQSAQACGHGKAIQKGASPHEYVNFVGSIEHGESGHNHHGHFLIWMRDCPDSWKSDPNAGILNPADRINQRCKPLESFWYYSTLQSPARYLRHENDMWSKLGHVSPVNAETGEAYAIFPAHVCGAYIAKYMDKEIKQWKHQIKVNHGLGQTRLLKTLQSMDVRTVEALTWRIRDHSTSISLLTTHSVPRGYLRSLGKTVLLEKRLASGTLNTTQLMQPSSEIYSEMLTSVRRGLRPKRMHSKAFYDFVTEHLPVPDGYCDAKVRRAHKKLGEFFPFMGKDVEKVILGGI
jgi:hypothetical protein